METAGRHIGLAFICLVISCLLLLTFTSDRPEEPIEILGNDYPKILSLGRSTFSLSVMAREQLQRLELRFFVLTPRNLVSDDLVVPDRQCNSSADLLDNVRKLVWFEETNSDIGILPEEFFEETTIEGSRYGILLRDYSDVLGSRVGPSLLGGNLSSSAPLVFAAIANDTLQQYLEGSSGFFVSPEVNLKSLSISHNEELTKYIPDDEVREGSLPISQAPGASVVFESVGVDDTITVAFGVEPLRFSRDSDGPALMLQMIRVYVDGESFGDPIVNVLR